MRQRSKLSHGSAETPEKKAEAAVNLNTPERITLQLDTSLCVVNEISTPQTETDCLSEDHELELNHVTPFLSSANSSWEDREEGNKTKGRKDPVLNRMKSFVSGVFLQPKAYARVISADDGNKDFESEMDTSTSLDNVSIGCRDVDLKEKGQPLDVQASADSTEDEDYATDPENIEIPYDDFVPRVDDEEASEAEAEAASLQVIPSEAEAIKLAQTEAETTEPTANTQLEVRSLNVSVQIKALTGVIRSRKKLNVQGTNYDSVRAVVSYQGTSLRGDEHVIMGSLSLPLLFEDVEKKSGQAKGYAKWPEKKILEDNEGASASNLTSAITFLRTMTRPRKDVDADAVEKLKDEQESCSSNTEGIEQGLEKDPESLPTVSTAFTPELLTLRVGLQKDLYETISLGVATAIIPSDNQVVELDIPVTRNCHDLAIKKKKLFALGSSSAYIAFPKDTMAKYKIDEGASLSIQLAVSRGKNGDQRIISDAGMTGIQADEINTDIRTSSRLSLCQKLQQFTELRKTQGGTDHLKADEDVGKADSPSDGQIEKNETFSSTSKSSEELRDVKITVVEPGHSTTQSKAITEADNDRCISTNLSVVTEASSVPLFELVVASKKSEDDHLSEISDSDSSSGGSFVNSLYSNFSANRRQGSDATEKVVKILTCDPTWFFRSKKKSEEQEKDEESSEDDASSSSGSSSSGSSVYEESGFVLDVDVDQETVEAEPVYKLPD